jgi:hypothetical protein
VGRWHRARHVLRIEIMTKARRRRWNEWEQSCLSHFGVATASSPRRCHEPIHLFDESAHQREWRPRVIAPLYPRFSAPAVESAALHLWAAQLLFFCIPMLDLGHEILL